MAKKQKPDFVNVSSLTDDQKKRLKGVITELSNSFTRMAAERDFVKETLSDIQDELNVDKKIVRKLAKAYFASSFDKEAVEFETYETFYESLLR